MIYFHKVFLALTSPLILNQSRTRGPGRDKKTRGQFFRGALSLALAILYASGLPAQPAHRLRAIGLLTWNLNPAAKPVPRLFPIAVFDGAKFYDATLYHVGSRPLALDPETVYEGQRSGTPVGFFTVESARLIDGTWFAQGRWKVRTPENTALSRRPVFIPQDDEKDERPHLKRSPDGVASKKAPATPQPANSTSPDKGSDGATPAAPASSGNFDDPDRPVLRRGRPEREKTADSAPGQGTAPPPVPGNGSKPAGPAAASGEAMVAVSDEQPGEPRAYAYVWKPGDEARMRGYMTSLASAEMQKYLRGHNYRTAAAPAPSPPPARRSAASPGMRRRGATARAATPPALEQVEIRPFDLTISNDQVIVYTARAKAWSASRPLDIFITLVARLNVEGVPHDIFSQVSDTDHLDIFPRLQLVDAVDAEGARRGDLLFRAFDAAGVHYVIYKVERDQVSKAFEGAYVNPNPSHEP